MIVNLVYMADVRIGGWASFTMHLAQGLQQAGHTVRVYKPTRRTENHLRDFGMGFQYQNVSQLTLDWLVRQPGQRMLIACCWHSFAPYLGPLVEAGAHLVVHDPAEIRRAPALTEAADRVWAGRLVVIRPVMVQHLPSALLVPHPYVRTPDLAVDRTMHAVAYSRLDWDKHTELIVGANEILPAGQQVQIYGSNRNRIFIYNLLDQKVPAWRRNYHGAMPKEDLWAGARLAARAHRAVDMSVIKNDGGGTQYTFLEALDAGTPLIIHKRWLTGVPEYDTMADYAVTASTAEELAGVLADPDVKPLGDPAELLAKHNAAGVARTILEH